MGTMFRLAMKKERYGVSPDELKMKTVDGKQLHASAARVSIEYVLTDAWLAPMSCKLH